MYYTCTVTLVEKLKFQRFDLNVGRFDWAVLVLWRFEVAPCCCKVKPTLCILVIITVDRNKRFLFQTFFLKLKSNEWNESNHCVLQLWRKMATLSQRVSLIEFKWLNFQQCSDIKLNKKVAWNIAQAHCFVEYTKYKVAEQNRTEPLFYCVSEKGFIGRVREPWSVNLLSTTVSFITRFPDQLKIDEILEKMPFCLLWLYFCFAIADLFI